MPTPAADVCIHVSAVETFRPGRVLSLHFFIFKPQNTSNEVKYQMYFNPFINLQQHTEWNGASTECDINCFRLNTACNLLFLHHNWLTVPWDEVLTSVGHHAWVTQSWKISNYDSDQIYTTWVRSSLFCRTTPPARAEWMWVITHSQVI